MDDGLYRYSDLSDDARAEVARWIEETPASNHPPSIEAATWRIRRGRISGYVLGDAFAMIIGASNAAR